MQSIACTGLFGLALSAMLATSSPVRALVAAPPAAPIRLAATDCVLVGKVTAIQEQPVQALPFPGAREKQFFLIATVQVQELFAGPKGVKAVKVGFPPPKGPMGQPQGPVVIISSGRNRSVPLTKDQEACFFLTRNPDDTFYTAPIFYDVIDKRSPNFAKDVAELRRCARLLEDADAGLKSKDAQERLTTAMMLIARYRTPPRGQDRAKLKTEPIAAAQSRLILETLASADWTRRDQLSPQAAFGYLGLTPQDGWTQPRDFRQFPAAAQKWLKANAATYRIQRYVVE